MSLAEVEIPVVATTSPSEPDRDIARSVLAIGELDLVGSDVDNAARHQSGRFWLFAEANAVLEPSRGPFAVSRDEVGGYIVQDLLGAVYGAGPTLDEAVGDLYVALDDHLAFLRERSAELHPQLLSQLTALEHLFPGH